MKLPNPNPEQLESLESEPNTTLVDFFIQSVESALASGQARCSLARFGNGLGVLVAIGPIEMMHKILADYQGEAKPLPKRGH
jgi:hypothetical protein